MKTYKTEDGHIKADCPICDGSEHVDYLKEHGFCLTCDCEDRLMFEYNKLKKDLAWTNAYIDNIQATNHNAHNYACEHADEVCKDEIEYPFNEGDDYWTLENEAGLLQAVLSCWDDQSEDMHTNDKVYYISLEELLKSLIETDQTDIVVCDYRMDAPYELKITNVNPKGKYIRVFQICFDVAETVKTTDDDRQSLCSMIEGQIGDFYDIKGNNLNFLCVNGDNAVEDMSHAYGKQELKDLNE